MCPCGHVGESIYPTPEGDGFYSSPTPPLFYKGGALEAALAPLAGPPLAARPNGDLAFFGLGPCTQKSDK